MDQDNFEKRDREFEEYQQQNPHITFGEYYAEKVLKKVREGSAHATLGYNIIKHEDWWEAGAKPFARYLKLFNLSTSNKVVDYGCGSLRIGAHFIRYLDPRSYFGLDVTNGFYTIGQEIIGEALLKEKAPRFGVIGDEAVSAAASLDPDFVYSSAVSYHVHPKDTGLYFSNLVRLSHRPGCTLFFDATVSAEHFRYRQRSWAWPLRHRRALVVVEGLYSMDGDIPPLAALVAIKQRYDAWLMVDEAHSIGVLGATGKGIAEEQGVDATSVDIWMGTLSKTFAASGGYIAGSRALIEVLKYTSAGFVFSVGLSPPLAAAAQAAIEIMHREPWRLKTLRKNGVALLAAARARGLDTGLSAGAAIVPIIVGSSPHALMLSQRLLEVGFNVVPAIFPGVAENEARLRLLVTSAHEPAQIADVLDATAEEIARIRNRPSFVRAVAGL